MKKFLALILALVMVLSLVACGGGTSNGDNQGTTDTSSMTAEEKEAAREEIRYAIALMFDRNYIVNDIAQGGQVPASSFVAMGMTEPDGTEFYKNAGHDSSYPGYYNVAEDAYEDNFNQAIEILKKYYTWDENAQQFIDTGSSPESGSQFSPSSVYAASLPRFSMRVRSTTSVRKPSSTRHMPRATLPLSVTVFLS